MYSLNVFHSSEKNMPRKKKKQQRKWEKHWRTLKNECLDSLQNRPLLSEMPWQCSRIISNDNRITLAFTLQINKLHGFNNAKCLKIHESGPSTSREWLQSEGIFLMKSGILSICLILFPTKVHMFGLSSTATWAKILKKTQSRVS